MKDNTSRRIVVVVAASSLAVVLGSTSAQAATVSLDANGNCFTVGMALHNGDASRTASVCWSTGGAEVLTTLRSDAGTGGLNQNVLLALLGGADFGGLVPSNTYNPTAACDCDADTSSDNWDTLTYSGFYLDVDGGTGADILDGGVDSDDTFVSGGDDADYCYNYSSIGATIGNGGNDQVVSDTTGGTDTLSGGSGDDCLWDTSATFTSCDCGENVGDNDLRHSSHSCTGSEGTTTCCGIC